MYRSASLSLLSRGAAVTASLLFSMSLHAGIAEYGAIAHLYTMSNAATGNSLLVYNIGFDGTLTLATSVSAGAKGTGGGIAAQGSLIIDSTGNYLIAVDAGANALSVFAINSSGGAVLVSRAASGGTEPISVTNYKNLVYVLNGGGTANNISGFTFSAGKLTPIPNSTLPLSAAKPNPGEISFSSDGKVLIVTEKATSVIDTYTVDAGGVAAGPITHLSNSPVPFGFNLASGNTIAVTEATTTTSSSVSTYTVGDDGSLTLITGSVPANGGAACWLAVSPDGEYAYTSDFDTAMMTTYSLTAGGTLGYVAVTPVGNGPADIAFDSTGNYLFLIDATDHRISEFAVNRDRSLTVLPGASGLPVGTSGLVIH